MHRHAERMMTINLAPTLTLGPVFDPEARGLLRFIPRREWWVLLPIIALASPAIGAVLLVRALCRPSA
jgi:hypothetical protein